jgi:acetyl esterase/lipase
MSSWVYLLLSLFGALLTYNCFRPTYAPGRAAVFSFFAGWLTSELALHWIFLQMLVTLLFAWDGAFQRLPGRLGLWISVGSWAGLAFCYWRGAAAEGAVERALSEGLGADYRSKIPADIAQKVRDEVDWDAILRPFPIRDAEVERTRNIQYWRMRGVNLTLDVYRHRSHPTNCPVLLEIHGGGWVVGSKNDQGLPMMLRMAKLGWVCVSANYRLSPHATFPEHLIDLKKALQWVREHIAEYGGNPDYVVVAGQSAGGHLASLMALTANDPEYQPGFESVDTSVRACMSFYGVYDFLDSFGYWKNTELTGILERMIMKASPAEDRQAYEKASPLRRIHPGAPPFCIVHGDFDTLVPVEEARHFARDLRSQSRAPVVYAEIPGAQHAFDIFPSLRGELVLAGVERFFSWVYCRHLAELEERDRPRATG